MSSRNNQYSADQIKVKSILKLIEKKLGTVVTIQNQPREDWIH